MPTSTPCAAAATAAERLPDARFHLEVIRLEALLDGLHGIVHGNLHQRDVDDADGAGPPRGDGINRDLIPVGHCTGNDSLCKGGPCTAEQST